MPGDATTARNNLAITPGNIGAAPAGYGLGDMGGNLTVLDDCHNVHQNGWYHVKNGTTKNAPTSASGVLRADFYGWKYGTITLYTPSLSTSGIRIYQKDRRDDVWSEWVECSPSAFAPSGYGLGGAAYTADLNKATKPGWYYTDPNTANTGRYYTAVHVKAWKDNSMIEQVQTDLNLTNFDRLHRYSKDSGATWTEEWENPLMQVGVAYQTTERWNGKPVYAKLIDIGYLPNATSKNIDGVIESGVDDLVELKCILKSGYVRRNSDGLVDVHLGVENPYAWLTVKTTSDMSAYTGKVLIKWTRP